MVKRSVSECRFPSVSQDVSFRHLCRCVETSICVCQPVPVVFHPFAPLHYFIQEDAFLIINQPSLLQDERSEINLVSQRETMTDSLFLLFHIVIQYVREFHHLRSAPPFLRELLIRHLKSTFQRLRDGLNYISSVLHQSKSHVLHICSHSPQSCFPQLCYFQGSSFVPHDCPIFLPSFHRQYCSFLRVV